MKGWILGGITGMGLLASLLAAAAGLRAQQTTPSPLSIVTVQVPAGSQSGEPQLTASDRGVLLSWIEHAGSKTTLRFVERTPTGWTEPRVVASGADWSVNAIDVPSVLRLADGTIVAQWLQQSGPGMHANDVRLSYSKDNGRTWTASFTPHPGGAQNERLFASLFQMPGSGLGLIWLEGPLMGAATGDAARSGHNHPAGADHVQQQSSGQQGHDGHDGRAGSGAMSGSGAMTLHFASFDTAWKQTAAMPILAAGRTGGASRMARHGDELVFAWLESNGGAGQVRTAVARVPSGVTR